jgi:hypothetical protein
MAADGWLHLGFGGLARERFYAAVEDLKAIVPHDARAWDPDGRRWEIDSAFLDELKTWEGRWFRATRPQQPRPAAAEHPLANHYTALHLLPSAPVPVVLAAHRALVQLHHPDRGGDTRTMQQINSARDQLVLAGRGHEHAL